MKIKILILILILLIPIIESQNYIEVNAGDVIVPHFYDWYFDGVDDYIQGPYSLSWSVSTELNNYSFSAFIYLPKERMVGWATDELGHKSIYVEVSTLFDTNYNQYTGLSVKYYDTDDDDIPDIATLVGLYKNVKAWGLKALPFNTWIYVSGKIYFSTNMFYTDLYLNGNYLETATRWYGDIQTWSGSVNSFKIGVEGRLLLNKVNIYNTTGLILYLDPTIYNSTSGTYVDLSGKGNDGIPYNGVQRIKAENKYLSILKGLRNDGKAHIIMPPQSTLKIIVGTEEVKRVYCNSLQEIVIPIGKYKYAIDENDTIILYVTPLILSGNTPLNNCSIEVFTDKINVVKTRSDNKIEILNAEGYLLTYIYGGMIQRYNITSDVLILDPQKVLNQWTIYAVPGVAIIITASPKIETNPFINISDIVNFYESGWSFLTYAIVLLLPVSVYLRTKSPGGAALTLLFAAAGGVALAPAFRPIGILLIVGAIAFLLYKVFLGE